MRGLVIADCRHTTEPDCGVKEALKKGKIACARYKSYLKMQKIFLKNSKNGVIRT
jgi:ribosome biogenesis GTPase